MCRVIMLSAAIIRGFDCVLLVTYGPQEAAQMCSACFTRCVGPHVIHRLLAFHSYPTRLCTSCPTKSRFSSRDPSRTISSTLIFNLPISFMVISCILILSSWNDIHSRCVELTKVALTGRRWAFLLLSKSSMYSSFIVIDRNHVKEC
jgi:hypothetical protein